MVSAAIFVEPIMSLRVRPDTHRLPNFFAYGPSVLQDLFMCCK